MTEDCEFSVGEQTSFTEGLPTTKTYSRKATVIRKMAFTFPAVNFLTNSLCSFFLIHSGLS